MGTGCRSRNHGATRHRDGGRLLGTGAAWLSVNLANQLTAASPAAALAKASAIVALTAAVIGIVGELRATRAARGRSAKLRCWRLAFASPAHGGHVVS
jgi:hypothetical protein